MHIERLRSFIKLAETGSFYAASKEVYLSQQGLSKAIAALESEIGVELFHRSHQGVTLTPAGQAVLAYARTIVEQHDEMIESVALSEVPPEPESRRIITYLTTYAMRALRCIDSDFLFERVQPIECTFREVTRRIDEPGDADLLVCGVWPERKEEVLSRSDIEFLPLLNTRVGVLVSEQSQLAQQEAIHRRDVAHLPIAIAANEDVRTGYEWIFRDVALRDVRMRTDDERLLSDFARTVAGGVSLYDSFNYYLLKESGSPLADGVWFVPLSTPRAEVNVGIITKRGSRSSVVNRASVQRLASWLTARYPTFSSRTPLAASEA